MAAASRRAPGSIGQITDRAAIDQAVAAVHALAGQLGAAITEADAG